MPRCVMDLADREVRSAYPSAYGGMIVKVRGTTSGSEWLPPELEKKPIGEVPDDMYSEMADRLTALIVESLWIEMVKTRRASYQAKREDAWNRVDLYRSAILSPTFDALMQGGSGEEVLRLLEQRFRKEFGEEFWSGKDGE